MKRQFFFLLSVLILFTGVDTCFSQPTSTEGHGKNVIDWTELATGPDIGDWPFLSAGLYYESIIVLSAGEAEIFERSTAEAYEWRKTVPLPSSLKGVATLSLDNGILCMGGDNGERSLSECFLLQWDSRTQTLKRSETLEQVPGSPEIPDLPIPLAYASALKFQEIIYVAGGQSTEEQEPAGYFFTLDLGKVSSPSEFKWNQLPSWISNSRLRPAMAAQNTGLDDCIYLFGGYTDAENPLDSYSKDVFRFNPKRWRNSPDSPLVWERMNDMPNHVAEYPPPSVAIGQGHVLAYCGADHSQPGIYAYHTITDTWTTMGKVPTDMVVRQVIPHNGKAYVVGIEKSAAQYGQLRVFQTQPAEAKGHFAGLDFFCMVLYLSALLAMGFYFARRENSTTDYFLAGRRVPPWAAAISLLGTGISAITFLTVTAEAYGTDWTYYISEILYFTFALFAIFIFIPFFRRLNLTTSYEYLEKRFNYPIRAYGSAVFIFAQLGRLMVVTYLPAKALSTVTGFNVYFCIILVGSLCTLYTWLGGIEAVIWTDVMQVLIFIGGALACIFVISFDLDGGPGEIIRVGAANNKFDLGNLGGDWTTNALWIVALGTVFWYLQVPVNQDLVQRYLVTRDEKQSVRSAWLNVVFQLPVGLLFFFLGTALYVYYKDNPTELSPIMNRDDILPWFITTKLPIGISGFVISAIFAASMSSVDSSMNSVATAFVTDFFRRLKRNVSDLTCLRVARKVTLVLGIFAVVMACIMAYWSDQINSILKYYWALNVLLVSSVAGVFLLGMVFGRPTWISGLIGALAGMGSLFYVKNYTDAVMYVYPVVGMTTCFIIGYLSSIFIGGDRERSRGYTIATLQKRKDE